MTTCHNCHKQLGGPYRFIIPTAPYHNRPNRIVDKEYCIECFEYFKSSGAYRARIERIPKLFNGVKA